MKRLSFATQLVLLWALVAVVCAALISVIWLMVHSDQARQTALAKQQATAVCESVASRYSLSVQSTGDARDADLMHVVLDIVLAQAPGIEGGFWTGNVGEKAATHVQNSIQVDGKQRVLSETGGFLAYAFPTYQGSGIKRDIPEAETPLILRTLRLSATSHSLASDSIRSGADAVVVSACPVPGVADIYTWMLVRTHPPLGEYGELLVTSLAVVLAGILGLATLLGVGLRRWKNNLTNIELSLAAAQDNVLSERLPHVSEPDLDKIVDAFNAYVARSETLQKRTATLSAQLTQAERFSSLGRLAAQVAHEIRNPLGAVRLKAENALSGDRDRQNEALKFILRQVERIETQVSSLLALTQPITLSIQAVDFPTWFSTTVSSHDEQARVKDVKLCIDLATLFVNVDEPLALYLRLDPDQLSRALDNLVLNALRHVPHGGTVIVSARQVALYGDTWLRIEVSDDGPGVPIAERESIFEPFVTGRPDGSGLGLAVVREIASAHGGRAFLGDAEKGACFVIEIPWQTSL